MFTGYIKKCVLKVVLNHYTQGYSNKDKMFPSDTTFDYMVDKLSTVTCTEILLFFVYRMPLLHILS